MYILYMDRSRRKNNLWDFFYRTDLQPKNFFFFKTLPFLHIGPNVNLVGKGRSRLGVEMPVGIRNLFSMKKKEGFSSSQLTQSFPQTNTKEKDLPSQKKKQKKKKEITAHRKPVLPLKRAPPLPKTKFRGRKREGKKKSRKKKRGNKKRRRKKRRRKKSRGKKEGKKRGVKKKKEKRKRRRKKEIFYEEKKKTKQKKRKEKNQLTASGLIFASGASNFHSLVLSISITPSITAWATCTPRGPNSLARLCVSARRANLPVAKADVKADPFSAAVAPVKMRVGGCGRLVDWRRRGRVAWEKRKAPRLDDF